MNKDRRSARDWVAAAVDALAEGGVAAIRVETLARRLGVTKGSFYWHFRDRPALLEAVLASWARVGTERVIRDIEASEGSPAERLETLWETTAGDPQFGVEIAIRGWARHDAMAQAAVESVDAKRLRFVAGLFRKLGHPAAEARPRALMCYALLLGDHFIQLSGSASARRAAFRRARRLLY